MPNPLCHFEFMTGDPQACQAFYHKVFDWQFDDTSMPGYTLIKPGIEPNGGMMKKPDQNLAACLHVYFQVTDLNETLSRTEDAGGKVIVPRTTIPHVGVYAMIADPEGVVIGLLETGH